MHLSSVVSVLPHGDLSSERVAGSGSSTVQPDTQTPLYTVNMDPDLRQFSDGPFRDLFQYWLGLKSGSKVPEAKVFQLVDIPHLVADILIAEYCGQRIRYRYSGTNYNMETGQDLTGLYIDELCNVDDIEERAHTCRETGKPFLVSGHPVTWTSKDFKTYSTLVLPLANAEGNVTRLVYLLTFHHDQE